MQTDMTRAEQAALKAYPNDERKVFHSAFGTLEIDKNAPYREGYVQGYEQAEKDLGWHSVKESLPPIEEEVIVLTDDIHGKIVPNSKMICYAHRPNPNGWDGKNMETGKVTHYTPKTYDGWNIPGVKFWMPCPEIPNND